MYLIDIILFRIINNNELQEKKLLMNLAIFLHNHKQYKDSVLPLPLAPLYVLPHQKWYFSSASMTPLRKRRQNTSLFKYIHDIEILSQKPQKNNNLNFSDVTQQIFCVYEKNSYFDNKMKHIFDTIYAAFLSCPNNKEKCKCLCSQNIDQDSSKYFISKVQTLNKCLNISKKNQKNESISIEDQKINWYEFTKNLINEELKIQSYSIPQQSLYLYKLPQAKDKNKSAYIFNVLWNDNYLIFNNGNKLQINQNMKSKTVQLCQTIHKKLNQYIWGKIQAYIPKIAEDVNDHQHFISLLKEKIKISTFRVWFYKKDSNNQIYILNLSHLSFKGIQCILYKEFNVKTQTIYHQNSNKQQFFSGKGQIKELNRSFESKPKYFSVTNKSHKLLKGLLRPTQLQRIKSILDNTKLDVTVLKPQQITIIDQQITQVQCQCCKDLLTSKQVVNQITANHIEQIRYLRQMKIGKIQYNPYQFVKVCTLCYNAYLQHYKRKSIDQKSQKNSIRNHNSSNKNSQSFLQKANFNFQNIKSKQSSFKVQNNSSKRLLFSKQSKERAKSQLNNSKQQPSFFNKQEKVMIRDRSISLRPPPLNSKPKHKKVHTTNTTNTQNTILQQQQQLVDFSLIPRTRTQQEHSISNHNSIKFKSQLPNKTHNLINKIITNSIESKKNNLVQFANEQEEAIKTVNNKIIMNAIDQYEKIQRFSFKKLITKNHRNYMIKQPPKQYEESCDNQSVKWKKPLKSYFQNN